MSHGYRRWFGWILALATVVVAALLIYQCLDIYLTGISPQNLTDSGVRINPIYTRETVSERLGSLVGAFGAWLGVLALALAFGRETHKSPSSPDARMALELWQSRAEPSSEMLKERKKRRMIALACGAVCAVCAAFALVYLLDIAHFTSRDLEPVVGDMMRNVLPWTVIAFTALMLAAYLMDASRRKEAQAAKKAVRTQMPDKAPAARAVWPNTGRIVLYALALALLVAGALNGGMRDVLVKAINICTECIGLG